MAKLKPNLKDPGIHKCDEEVDELKKKLMNKFEFGNYGTIEIDTLNQIYKFV